jgi:hypothetical protein
MTDPGIALRILDRIVAARGLEELQRIRDELDKAGLSAFGRQRIEEALVDKTGVLMDAIAKKADKIFPVDKPLEPKVETVIVPGAPPRAIDQQIRPADLTSRSDELVAPIVTPAQASFAWKQYVAIAQAIEDPADVVEIQGHRFRKKSFWRKLALVYGIDVELREAAQELKDDAKGAFWSSHVVVRARSRTGRYVDGVASCSNREPAKADATAHVVYATAYTRAANRAIADLVAAGEVSAEEVE